VGISVSKKETEMTGKHKPESINQKSIEFVKTEKSNNLSTSVFNHGGRHRSGYYKCSSSESYRKVRIDLYRFLRDNIPLLSSCIWTWTRLCSAPGHFRIEDDIPESKKARAIDSLEKLGLGLYPYKHHRSAGLDSFMPLLFNSLFTDGAFAGFLLLKPDMSGVDCFEPVDSAHIAVKSDRNRRGLYYQSENGEITLDSDDFYYLGLDSSVKNGLGRSILASIPFVAHIEQQLIDDMRRTMHNSGYHRLHVKINPPDRHSGESDDAYTGRINEYFDSTVSMIKDCQPDDNPVTWDNVTIDYVGPRNVNAVSNSWSLTYRAMVEEICAGTNLSPFMLGYSYGTTHNWAEFKYDLVMRHVQSVQRQAARFLEWMGNIELALKGFSCNCRYIFDNSLTYMASERSDIQKSTVDNIIRLYTAGLISKETASDKAGDLI
jgi:hypothetical protein